MRAVAVAELVVDTEVELEGAAVEVVLGVIIEASGVRASDSVVDRRLEVELPSLVGTEVVGEVETQLRGELVVLLEERLTRTVGVTPAEASYCDHLEGTRLALVASNPVADVDGTEQAHVAIGDNRVRLADRLWNPCL